MMSPGFDVRKPWLLAATWALFVPALAHAQDERTSSLSWVRLPGAESCLTASALAASVEQRLNRKVFLSPSEADLDIEGSIGPRAGGDAGFVATLRVTSREGESLGERVVDSGEPECAAIDDELTLIVSLLIDPDALAMPPPEPPPQPAPEPPPAPVPPPKPPEPKIETRIVEKRVLVREPDPWRWELSAGVMGTLGVQPGVGVAFAPAFVIELPGLFGIVLEGGIAAPSTAESEDFGVTARAQFMHGALGLCPLGAHGDRLTVLACAGWLLGAVVSEGEGFAPNGEGTSVVNGPWIEGRLTVRIVGPVGLTTSVGMLVPVTRAELFFNTPAGEQVLHETSPLAGLADVAVSVRIP